MTRTFVGRRAELTHLRRVLARPGDHVVVVEAPAGFGKTAFIDELVRQLGPVTAVRASPIAQEAATSWSTLRALSREWEALPSPVAIAIGRAASDTAVSAGEVAFAWVELLRDRCEREPCVVVVDDLHWCDAATATVLGIALREVPCTWLLGVRPGESPLDIGRIVPPDRLSLVELPPMRRSELAELVASTTSRRWGPVRIDEIAELSDGSPLLAVELAREADAGRLRGFDRRPITAVYADRLATLSEDVREVVALTALASRPTLALAAEAWADRDVIALLETAERSGIVRVDGDAIGFVHPLCRHAVVEGIGSLERAALHRRLAQLEADPDASVRHLALGTSLPDADVAERLEAAAVDVRRRGSAAGAAWLFERAARLTPDSDQPAQRRRRASAGVAYADAEEIDRAATLLAGVTASIDDLDEELRSSVVAVTVMVADRQHGKQGADAAARQLLAGANDGQLRARLWRLIVRIHQYDDLRRAESIAVEALDDAARTGGPEEVLGARAVLANVRFLRGEEVDLDGLLADLERSTAQRIEGTSAASLVQELLAWDDRFDEVRALLAGLVESAPGRGSSAFRADLLSQWSYVELRAGDVALAEQLAVEAVELLLPRPGLETFAVAETLLVIHGLRGERVAVDDWIESATPEVDDAPALLQALFHANAGFARLSLGDLDASLDHLVRAGEISRRVGLDDARSLPWAADLVDVQLLVGDIDGARSTLGQLVLASERCRSSAVRADRLRAEGIVALADGDAQRAVELLADAVDVAEVAARPLLLARCAMAFGAALRRSGRRRDARDALGRARRSFAQLGAEPWMRRVDDELRRAGYGRSDEPPSTELTATEQRIVELVIVGRSNREIAAELFVTVRTVESNLTRVYRKLGIRRRTELVARGLR